MSLEPGLRLTVNRGSVPGRGAVYSTTPIGWRLGAAWDILPSHRTVLRGHYGRYFDPTFNYIFSVQDVTGRSVAVTYEIEPSGERVEVDRGLSTLTRR